MRHFVSVEVFGIQRCKVAGIEIAGRARTRNDINRIWSGATSASIFP